LKGRIEMMTLTLGLEFSNGATKENLSQSEKYDLKQALVQAFALDPKDAEKEMGELLKPSSISRNYVPGMKSMMQAAMEVLKSYNDKKGVRCKFVGI